MKMYNLEHTKGVIILSGGNSSRMNYPKPYLLYRDKTFLQVIVEEYFRAGINNITVVMNKNFCGAEWNSFLEPVKRLAKIIENNKPESGRLVSLKLASDKMKDLDFCFIQNIDNPFLTGTTIAALWENRNVNGYTTPMYKGKGGHPVLISNNIIKHIISLPAEDLPLKEVLGAFDKKMVETNDEKILININTKHDYEYYIQMKNEPIL
jgi:molybdenum cofactor cytidylyltransferase